MVVPKAPRRMRVCFLGDLFATVSVAVVLGYTSAMLSRQQSVLQVALQAVGASTMSFALTWGSGCPLSSQAHMDSSAVEEKLGPAPQFWGRFIGASVAVTLAWLFFPPELDFVVFVTAIFAAGGTFIGALMSEAQTPWDMSDQIGPVNFANTISIVPVGDNAL